MSLKLMYTTNDPILSRIAENSGVDWIFVDLEIIGKFERQGHLDTKISRHKISDVKIIKKVLKKAKLLVRVNPIHNNSKSEIDKVIEYGADIVMLPYFKKIAEIKEFLNYVNNRAEVCLLLETPDAVEILDEILEIKGIKYIHIGINDLHLGYGMKFMFELLSDGTVENIIEKIKKTDIAYGFGGIVQLSKGILPAEYIIAEHYRLKSSMAIISRSFCDISASYKCIARDFNKGIKDIRDFEKSLRNKNQDFFINNQEQIAEKVKLIINAEK